MKAFAYIRAASEAEAVENLLEYGGQAKILSGGMDLLDLLKERLETPEVVISLADLEGLDAIEEGRGGQVLVGAKATLSQISEDDLISARYPALAQSAGKAATPQIRNRATIGGNILQRPRCWYFRKSECDCLKKGGNDCPAIAGDNRYLAILGGGPCHAVHASSLACALVALDASVQILGEDGLREVSVSELFTPPTVDVTRENSLLDTDVLLSFILPADGGLNGYYKIRHKEAYDWAMAEVGISIRLSGSTVSEARIVLGGVAPIPWRAQAAESYLEGRMLTASTIAEAAERALSDATPLSMNAYKVPIAKRVVEQALLDIAGL